MIPASSAGSPGSARFRQLPEHPGGRDPNRTAAHRFFHVFGYVGPFFSLVLILRVIIAIPREGI